MLATETRTVKWNATTTVFLCTTSCLYHRSHLYTTFMIVFDSEINTYYCCLFGFCLGTLRITPVWEYSVNETRCSMQKIDHILCAWGRLPLFFCILDSRKYTFVSTRTLCCTTFNIWDYSVRTLIVRNWHQVHTGWDWLVSWNIAVYISNTELGGDFTFPAITRTNIGASLCAAKGSSVGEGLAPPRWPSQTSGSSRTALLPSITRTSSLSSARGRCLLKLSDCLKGQVLSPSRLVKPGNGGYGSTVYLSVTWLSVSGWCVHIQVGSIVDMLQVCDQG